MRILIDMDDVLEKLCEAWVDYLNAHFGTHTTMEDVNDWDLCCAFPTLTRDQVYCVALDDAFWGSIQPMPGADEALRKFLAEGHEVYIVTATYYQTLKAKMDDLLFRYFPYLSWENVIITFRKQLIRGDVLIDDGPHNLRGGDYHKILFTANHNRTFDEKSIGAVRADSWDDVCRLIEEYDKAGHPAV